MKTELIRCCNAYMAVLGLARQEWDYPSAYALTRLRRALQPHVDFFVQEEDKLIRQYGKTGEDGQVEYTPKGTFLLRDPGRAGEYNAKRMELGGVEVELDWEKRALPRPERVTPVQLEALEGFVRFGGEDA